MANLKVKSRKTGKINKKKTDRINYNNRTFTGTLVSEAMPGPVKRTIMRAVNDLIKAASGEERATVMRHTRKAAKKGARIDPFGKLSVKRKTKK
tara:strand:+ start:43 stop:324 length:282 start_codon:yes stop_codon:yes gene_type:complete